MCELAPAWERIRRSRADVRLLTVGSGIASDPGFPGAEHRAWSARSEAESLAESDVGLAPLPDDPWSRGKCAARLLTYLAAGVAAVASPVGAQQELADEVGGVVLARDARAFAEAAIELLEDVDRRIRRVTDAFDRLTATRSIGVLEPRFLAHLIGEGRPGAGDRAPPVAGPVHVE
jgi:glycosyltransferase involved in cell wall biosynthesis